MVIEPGIGKEKLKEAIKICRETIILNPKEKDAEGWAATQNHLCVALQNQGIRTDGKAGADFPAEAVTACREALTVYTRDSLPQDWARTQNNLGIALFELGKIEKRIDLLIEAKTIIQSIYSYYKEGGELQYNDYFDEKLEAIEKSIKKCKQPPLIQVLKKRWFS